MDPLVTLDGTEQLPAPEETTAGRIVAAGGSARASSVSVTDARRGARPVRRAGRRARPARRGGQRRRHHPADELRHGHRGGLARRARACTSTATSTSSRAALPIMAAAGHGRILGVTSGSGWRAGRRRRVQLRQAGGRRAHLAARPARARRASSSTPCRRSPSPAWSPPRSARVPASAPAGGSSATGGLSLGSMPAARGARAARRPPGRRGPSRGARGQVIFAGGSEVAVIDQPRLLEVVRTDDVASLAARARGGRRRRAGAGRGRAGEQRRRATRGSARSSTSAAGDAAAGRRSRSCAVVTDRPGRWRGASPPRSRPRASTCHAVDRRGRRGFAGAAAALASTAERPVRSTPSSSRSPAARRRTGATQRLGAGARRARRHRRAASTPTPAWARAVADHAARDRPPVRLVTLTDATTAGGRSRAQASAQLARAGRRRDRRPGRRVRGQRRGRRRPTPPSASSSPTSLCSPDAPALSGRRAGGRRRLVRPAQPPAPGGSVTFGGPDVPDWLDDALRRRSARRGGR